MNKDRIAEILKGISLPIEEDAVDNAFGNVAFGGDSDHRNSILKLQKKPSTVTEPNTEKEDTLYDALYRWVDSPDTRTAEIIMKYKNLILQAQKKFPTIFKPETPNGTTLYRGLENISNQLLKKLYTTTTTADWKQVNSAKGTYVICTVPIKYSPRRSVQSWTDSYAVAENFTSDAMLVTKQDSNFLFNQNLMNILYGGKEREVLHAGREYDKLYIAVHREIFYNSIVPRLMNKTKGGTKLKNIDQIVGLKKK